MDQIVYGPVDLTYLSWSKIRNSSGTAGSFLKSQETTPEGKIYYKLSNYDAYYGVTGHESVNEIIAGMIGSTLYTLHIFLRDITGLHIKLDVSGTANMSYGLIIVIFIDGFITKCRAVSLAAHEQLELSCGHTFLSALVSSGAG